MRPLRLMGSLAAALPSASDDFGGLVDDAKLGPVVARALAALPPDALLASDAALRLMRCVAERPSVLLSPEWLPLLHRLLHTAGSSPATATATATATASASASASFSPSASASASASASLSASASATASASAASGVPLSESKLALLLDSLYLTLYFVRSVQHGGEGGEGGGEDQGGGEGRAAGKAAAPAARARLLASLPPLLSGGGASATLMRLLLSPSVPLAEQAAHTLALAAQLIAPRQPQAACRALLASPGAAAVLVALLRRGDRPEATRRALKALGWLRAADAAEFDAALASSPELAAEVEAAFAAHAQAKAAC